MTTIVTMVDSSNAERAILNMKGPKITRLALKADPLHRLHHNLIIPFLMEECAKKVAATMMTVNQEVTILADCVGTFLVPRRITAVTHLR